MKANETARVSVVIAVDPATAFSIFTKEIGQWWRPKIPNLFREGSRGVMKFEPGPNGRLLEVYAGSKNDSFEVGRVRAWIPGERLVFEWRQRGFGPDDVTEVEVRFIAVKAGTRVTLEHRGWEKIGRKHPARYGWTGEALATMIGLRWGDQLTSLRAHAAHFTAKNTLKSRSKRSSS